MQVEVHITEEPLGQPTPTFRSDCGAVVEFHGVVRESENQEPITALVYEAYLPMAERLLRDHLEAVLRKHDCRAGVVHHRIGTVPVGEASLYVAVASPHRKEALSAVGDFIDRLKTDVPIWKTDTIPATV